MEYLDRESTYVQRYCACFLSAEHSQRLHTAPGKEPLNVTVWCQTWSISTVSIRFNQALSCYRRPAYTEWGFSKHLKAK